MAEYRIAGRCAMLPACHEAGEFRAPARAGANHGFDGPGKWQWFCLEHVRQFNAGYNFFAGMSEEEIYAAQTPYAGWDRETRAFSAAAGSTPRWQDFNDPLEAISTRFAHIRTERKDGRTLSSTERRALKTLGLDLNADRKALRQRYAALVRKYHPDRNGGDRSHEKALAEVISAYTRLKSAPAFA